MSTENIYSQIVNNITFSKINLINSIYKIYGVKMFISEIEKLERKETFINKSLLKYGAKFDYSKVKYINSITKVIIICIKHGEFLKTPVKHLIHKHSCPNCAKDGYSKAVKISKKDFINLASKVHNNKYIYEKTSINKRSDKIKIYCTIHKKYFHQRLNLHLRGFVSCRECLKERKEEYLHEFFKDKFIKAFIEKFGNDYNFSKVLYKNNMTPVIVKCNKHNLEFMQVHRNIKRSKNCSCPNCKKENQ